MFYAYSDIDNRGMLFAFLIAFFVFLLGRDFLQEFFKYKVENFDQKTQNHAWISSSISLLTIIMVYPLCSKRYTLGYTVMNSAYLAGRGTGSSYIAELYQDFGYTGIILGNILYSFLLARITKNEDNDSLLKKSIKFMIITQLLWAPRGSFTYFISQNLTPTTIATLLLVFGISYLWEKRKYARKRKYS